MLKAPPVPTLASGLTLPEFTVVYGGAADDKCPSHYLQNSTWVETLKATVKGVRFGEVDDGMVERAKILLPAMQQRLVQHIEEFVHPSKYRHYTLDFVRDNLPAMAAIKCLVGQVVDRLELFGVDECLLWCPGEVLEEDVFFSISNAPEDSQLGAMEGDYLSYDTVRRKWIRSGKASGIGKDACFVGRNNTHAKNARSTDQMRQHRYYQKYPARGVENIGAVRGYFEDIEVYCGMGFDREEDVSPLCLVDSDKSLFAWSKKTLKELRKKDGDQSNQQLIAISYLWELCDSLLMARDDNVSRSPGFESLGLRVNK